MKDHDILMAAAAVGDMDHLQGCSSLTIVTHDHGSWTPLMYAAHCDHPEAVDELVDVYEGMQTSNGTTALMLAILGGARECALRLVQVESERGKQNAHGKTALMLAVRLNMLDVAKILMPYEKDLIDHDGHDVLWFTDDNNRREVTCFYTNARIDPPSPPLSTSPSLMVSQFNLEHSTDFPASLDTSDSASLKYIEDLLNGRIRTFREIKSSGKTLDPSIRDANGKTIEEIAMEVVIACKDEAISSKKNTANLVLELCRSHRQKDPSSHNENGISLSSLIQKL